ncbi:MAG TPA: hypothetical protein VN370_11495 [Desulfitobacteriaceae bacterium]|nr:hypothetical protein [Desulfitobacteriaceae bacterium]
MNIFQDSEHILGFLEPDVPKNSLQNFFELAREFRGKLGPQSYLLDHYLFLVLKTANNTLAYESANEGFGAGCKLRSLCFDVIDGKETHKNHPFYETVQRQFREHRYTYKEKHTVMGLLYLSLAETYFEYAFRIFWNAQERNLKKYLKTSKLNKLYARIVSLVGEDLMAHLDEVIKERFFIVPVAAGFVQGFTNDLIFTLTAKDDETGQKVFQLLLDQSR